jgi:hypothetical protein
MPIYIYIYIYWIIWKNWQLDQFKNVDFHQIEEKKKQLNLMRFRPKKTLITPIPFFNTKYLKLHFSPPYNTLQDLEILGHIIISFPLIWELQPILGSISFFLVRLIFNILLYSFCTIITNDVHFKFDNSI